MTESTPKVYDFDSQTQDDILTCLMTDNEFCRRTHGLIKSEYFEDDAAKVLADIVIRFFDRDREVPVEGTIKSILGFMLKAKKIRDDLQMPVLMKFKEVYAPDKEVKNRLWLMENAATFARQKAFEAAIIESSEIVENLRDEKRFDKSFRLIKTASETALASASERLDYFGSISKRTQERIDISSGAKPKTGITTGIAELDELMLHGGYGRKELTVWMGGAKSGKSFAIVQACASAVLDGRNVLHVTLENSVAVCAMRYDAFFSNVGISDQFRSPHEMEAGVKAVGESATVGKLEIREFPSGSFRPIDLRNLLDEYADIGIHFDLIGIDYLDIMAPDHRTDNPIENSKSIWIAVRGIMQTENAAGVTATQTNRTGHKAVVARAEDVAEDFSKIRIADLVISINRQDDEKHERKARLYLAAGRNQEDGRTIFVTQDLNKGRSVSGVDMVE